MKESRTAKGRLRTPFARNSQGDVSLRVERLVIEGMPLSTGQAGQLKRAVQGELTQLLQRDGLGANFQGFSVPVLAAPAIQIPPSFEASDVGRQIARCVYQSLTQKI